MWIGFVSMVFQGLAAGVGMVSLMSAAQVWVAEVAASEDGGPPCVCYYKLDDLRLAISVSTPLLLLYAYLQKQKRFTQALLSGDYLYYKTFDVPYRVVEQNKAWESLDLLIPRPLGVEGEAHSLNNEQSRSTRTPFLNCLSTMMLGHKPDSNQGPFSFIMLLVVQLPATISMTTFVPRLMSVLSRLASNSVERDWFQQCLIYVALIVPSLSLIFLAVWQDFLQLQPLIEKAKTSLQESSFGKERVLLIFIVTLLMSVWKVYVGVMLLPPTEVWQRGQLISPAKMLLYCRDWACSSLIGAQLFLWSLMQAVGIGSMSTLARHVHHHAPLPDRERKRMPAVAQTYAHLLPEDEGKHEELIDLAAME